MQTTQASSDLRPMNVTDLVPGALVDLTTCPYLKSHAMAPYEYGQVTDVDRETPECVAVSYEGIDTVGYPVDTVLQAQLPAEEV